MLLKRITPLLLLLLVITFVASSVGATNSGNLLRYLTGDLSAVFQPRAFHPASHSVTPF